MIVETPLPISFLLFSMYLSLALVAVLNWRRADKRAHAVPKRTSPAMAHPGTTRRGSLSGLGLQL